MLSFTDRMDLGRDLAARERNNGRGGSQTVYATTAAMFKAQGDQVDAGSWDYLCQLTRRDWRSDVNQIRVDFAAACLNGPGWADDLAAFGVLH